MQRGRIVAAVMAASLGCGALAIAAAGSAAAATPEAAFRSRSLAADAQTLQAQASTPGVHAASLGPVALSAPIPSMTIHDGVGDAPFSQGDLTGVGMLQNASGTAFGVTVKAPTNPNIDSVWQVGSAAVGWYLDTNGNGLYEYLVLLGIGVQSHKMLALVTDPSGNHRYCTAAPVYVAHVGYRVTAPAGCIPHLKTARFAACMVYTTDINDTTPPTDCAPNGQQLGPPTAVQESLHEGYWMLGADGLVYSFGGALGFPGTVPGAVAMAPRKDGQGYWVVDLRGHVFSYGSAKFFGGAPALGAGESVRTISATSNGGGYWLFTNKGRAFPFGNAKSFGDMTGVVLNGPIVASVATSSGKGYYMVGSDGGIFSFGDARFHGSTGNLRLNKPVVGMSPTPDGKGYWLVASDGGVFAFNAPFRGSMGGTTLNRPVDGLVAFGNGYLMAASDGGIFDFSNKKFFGSLAGRTLPAPIIGLAAFSS